MCTHRKDRYKFSFAFIPVLDVNSDCAQRHGIVSVWPVCVHRRNCIHCNVGWINEKPYSCWECPINSHIACIYLRHTQTTCNKNEQLAVSLVTHTHARAHHHHYITCVYTIVVQPSGQKGIAPVENDFLVCVCLITLFIRISHQITLNGAVCIGHSLHFITSCDDRNYILHSETRIRIEAKQKHLSIKNAP